MSSKSLVALLNQELRAAGSDLVDNSYLLQGILAGCGDCIKILDLDGKLQFMSEGGKRVMEVDDFRVLKGCPWSDFWPGEGNAAASNAVNAAKAGQTAHFRGPANTAKGTPRYWDVNVSPIPGEDGRPAYLLSISRDITEEWNASQQREEAARRERFLTEESQHRAKNAFALVIALAQQTFKGEMFKSAMDSYRARIRALAQSQDAIGKSSWGNTPIRNILAAAIAPHDLEASRFTLHGPGINVNSRQATSLSLAINELATNAAKYGALSSPEGKIDIEWTRTDGEKPVFTLTWCETGGPVVSAPAQYGFGSRVIKDFMADDVGGSVHMSDEPAGVICQLKTPLENLPV